MSELTETELRELDAWIAEHVMGFQWRRLNRRDTVNRLVSPEAIKRGFGLYDPLPEVKNDNGAPYYTTDRAAAMDVLERCMEYSTFPLVISKCPSSGDYWIRRENQEWEDIEAETLPLAICLFAKKLFGKE